MSHVQISSAMPFITQNDGCKITPVTLGMPAIMCVPLFYLRCIGEQERVSYLRCQLDETETRFRAGSQNQHKSVPAVYEQHSKAPPRTVRLAAAQPTNRAEPNSYLKRAPPPTAMRVLVTGSLSPTLVHFMPTTLTMMLMKPSSTDTTMRARHVWMWTG
ncbi:hypothetical protein EYF80_010215 [Liparis tanakae]|uniref:Uncharacterized protein n=1 Tax=Liparis tanakae TaxID=230148 RepID=A0A4Z2IR23_9TELE|nr:hypothetical protein EYF80_010215 [Liparis tanakae]